MLNRDMWGSWLIAFGVAAWLPYFYLVGQRPNVPVFPFLAAHLAGVLGGARLKLQTKGLEHNLGNRKLALTSKLLIYFGVLAWAPYIYLSRVLHIDTSVGPFLITHLTGVLSGISLRAYIAFSK
ncbi:MAG: hypothetical protein DWG76_07305 [Chloroflexi bacterium]|nr:hypothetical protein [Chloroflexota bacterium]